MGRSNSSSFRPKARNASPPKISSTDTAPSPAKNWEPGTDHWKLMPISPARTAAFDILLRVARTDAYAAELLHSPQYCELSRKDHSLATELVMGVLRWQ